MPAPEEDDLRERFWRALLDVGDDYERKALFKPTYNPRFKAEWTGLCAATQRDRRVPSQDTSRQIYENLVQDQKSSMTILYIQGGAFV